MSRPSDQPNGGRIEQYAPTDMQPTGRFGPAQPPPSSHRRPWAWIAACVVLLLVAGGFAFWAVGLQSDLNDQKDRTAQAQQEAKEANAAADDLSAQVDDITQSVNDASDQLSQAGQDARDNAQAAIDGIKGKLTSLKDRAAQRLEQLRNGGTSDAQPTATP